MELQLAGKRALVTGASGAIGEAIATRLAVERASVIVHGRNKGTVDRVVETITATGGLAAAAVADLTDDDAVAGLAAEHGEIDILVNLTVSLARELTGSGVTVNTVSPGIVATPGVEAFFRADAETHGRGTSWPEIEAGVVRDILPNSVGRLARAEEVADLVAFLASPRADIVTSANYRIDGGSTTSIN